MKPIIYLRLFRLQFLPASIEDFDGLLCRLQSPSSTMTDESGRKPLLLLAAWVSPLFPLIPFLLKFPQPDWPGKSASVLGWYAGLRGRPCFWRHRPSRLKANGYAATLPGVVLGLLLNAVFFLIAATIWVLGGGFR